ncbi:hypothetical protein KFK09_010488 [Dendrobium nobile]|uniref:RING-type domain-containing protein n=1 Tax=Dendrobium nobile TaxID=94219 RepID=A0A8T3BFR7_DENNO|nr:hypothetical protein KFK09_010488 [Dendrobium nobile]
MAVQAQYPANVLLLDRAETDRSNEDMDFTPPSFLDQSPVFFSSNGGNANPRKRGREAASAAIGVPMVFSIPPAAVQPPTAVIGLSQPRSPVPTHTVVSTGLRLALDEQNQRQQSDSLLSAFVSEELAAQMNQQKDEIEQFLLAQREQLRRALIARRHHHYRALLLAAEKSVIKRLREKEAEVELASRRSAELEDRLTRLRSESMAWQSKAMAEQATAASLHAQLQRAAAAAAATAREDCYGESPADDAESVYVDPERAEAPWHACRACLRRPASMVLIPCRHLCLCPACDFAAAGEGCPICGAVRTGSVQVFLS